MGKFMKLKENLSHMISKLIDTIRQPKYTGKNRCLPCTIVNLGIATGVSLLISRKSQRLSKITFAGSVVLIYIRGYLVPGTPSLTKRYLPDSVLRAFEKEPPASKNRYSTLHANQSSTVSTTSSVSFVESTANSEEAQSPSKIDIESLLFRSGIIESCQQEDDFCLTDGFADDWERNAAETCLEDVTADGVVDLFGEEGTGDIDHDGNNRVLLINNQPFCYWPSDEALVADIASANTMSQYDHDWRSRSAAERWQLLRSLRLFVETCPISGQEAVLKDERVESCCRSVDVVTIQCGDSEARLLEQPLE